MKSRAVVSAVLALCLTASGLSLAQGYPGRNDRDQDQQSQRGERNDRRNDGGRASERRDHEARQPQHRDHEARQPQRRDHEARQPQRRDSQDRQWDRRDSQARAYNQERRDQRGAGPNHQYYRGDRLPVYYRSHQYVVDDWRGHRLSAPPRGYHWVQSGGDYLLVAIATGVILQLLLNNY